MTPILDPDFDEPVPGETATGPLYTFTYVTDPPDRCAYYVLAYPMRGAQSSWTIVPGTIVQDVPADEFDLEPLELTDLTEKTDVHAY